ncbi:HAD hydrolase family protein [Olsenella massiliensis]|uniref:HAD hydrolase family protein n=1 Tax=Olsenella massiliensis TaxID=1622075 RepID=UPI00071CA7A3|nr:HAD hydrolase family protein [Olsenella massiliensis]
MATSHIQARPSMVFCDLDGTLLARDKSLGERTRRVLGRLDRAGIEFVVSTGRSIEGIPDELMSAVRLRYAITADGASIYGPGDASGSFVRLRLHDMPADETLGLIRLVEATDSYIDLFSEGVAFVSRGQLDKLAGLGVMPADVAYMRSVRHEVDGSLGRIVEEGKAVERLTIFPKDDATRDCVSRFVDDCGSLAVFCSQPANMEVVSSQVSKGNALRWLCGRLGVPTEEVIAFGDSANDGPMLQAAGVGVAMPDAPAQVRTLADTVCPLDCDHEGVAALLEDILAPRQVPALLMHEKDDVVTCLGAMLAGDVAAVRGLDGHHVCDLAVRERVGQYHKLARRDVGAGDLLRKYGEVIGVASAPIAQGRWVHAHNVESVRTRA